MGQAKTAIFSFGPLRPGFILPFDSTPWISILDSLIAYRYCLFALGADLSVSLGSACVVFCYVISSATTEQRLLLLKDGIDFLHVVYNCFVCP